MGRKKIEAPPEPPKPYGITQADIDSITDLDVAFATTRCLPKEEEIPEAFRGAYRGDYKSNIYVALVDALFCGEPVPQAAMQFHAGFEKTGENPKLLQRFTMAHLRSFEPSHEHKISGIAYMLSLVVTITAE
jgi:hypothetical protein